MTDIELAKESLEGHSICLCKGGDIITDDGRGISPMMKFIGMGKDLKGYSAADMIVGKAAAMLFVKAGICAVHGKVMSEAASEYLEALHIPHSYDKLTEQIINRTGDNICPMEAAVANISDPEEGYKVLFNKIQEMRKNN